MLRVRTKQRAEEVVLHPSRNYQREVAGKTAARTYGRQAEGRTKPT